MNLKSSLATEAVAKIEKLSKLVSGANVTIRDIFMAQAIKDNIPDGGKINTLASLDRQSEQTRFTEFKSTFRQTFSVPPTETFVNFEKNYPKDYSNGQKDQRDSRLRDSRLRDRRPKSPHWSTRNKRAGSSSRSNSRGRRGHSDSRSGFASVNFHITGPSNSTCLIDTGAQRSCITDFCNLRW